MKANTLRQVGTLLILIGALGGCAAIVPTWASWDPQWGPNDGPWMPGDF